MYLNVKEFFYFYTFKTVINTEYKQNQMKEQ